MSGLVKIHRIVVPPGPNKYNTVLYILILNRNTNILTFMSFEGFSVANHGWKILKFDYVLHAITRRI